jgi:hypothetical protein
VIKNSVTIYTLFCAPIENNIIIASFGSGNISLRRLRLAGKSLFARFAF